MKNIQPYIALFLANLIYAGNFTIAKVVIPDYIEPFGMICIRVVIAALLFWIVGAFIKKDPIQDKKDYGLLFVCAFFGVALNQLTFFKGLAMTNPINPAIIMTVTPIIVLIVSAVGLKEKVGSRKIAGISLGMIGAICLLLFGSSKGGFSVGSDTFMGDSLVMVNAASYAVYLVLAKPLFAKYQPLTIVKWVFTFGIIFVVPFGFEEFHETDFSLFDNDAWWALGYIILMTTFFAYLFNAWALQHVKPTVVSIFIYLQPLLASIIAIIVEKDSLTVNKVLFALIIFAGVYLVSVPKKLQKLKD